MRTQNTRFPKWKWTSWGLITLTERFSAQCFGMRVKPCRQNLCIVYYKHVARVQIFGYVFENSVFRQSACPVIIVKFAYNGVFEEIIERLGTMPLPPYIKTKLQNKGRYQTVYARTDGSASSATLSRVRTEVVPTAITRLPSRLALFIISAAFSLTS